MRDYKPPSNFPGNWQPRYIRGEYSVPLESPVHRPEHHYTVPDTVQVRHCEVGETTAYFDRIYNNTAREEPKAPPKKVVKEEPQKKERKPRKDRYAWVRDAIIEYMVAVMRPCMVAEIPVECSLSKRGFRHQLQRLVDEGQVKQRCYSVTGVSGHTSQYIASGVEWPPLPEGGRLLKETK